MAAETQNMAHKKDTLACARDALELECRFSFGAIPTDDEFRGWLKPIAEDDARLRAIFERRNNWILKFAEKIPDFWESLYAENRDRLKP